MTRERKREREREREYKIDALGHPKGLNKIKLDLIAILNLSLFS